MKNYIFKTLLTLILSTFTLPMLSQDFMNIYFKDGSFRIIHFNNIKEINTSKIDADGNLQSDYSFQHIKTNDEEIIYNISEIDSITFTKYYEEKVINNLTDVSLVTLPLLSHCESVEDAADYLDEIKQSSGIENAWVDGNFLYIKLSNWQTFSYAFFPKIENNNNNYAASRLFDSYKSRKKVNNPDGVRLKAVVANQQHFDNCISRQLQISGYMFPLKNKFDKAGYDVDYLETPDLDFFYNDMFDYDVVFLSTHGGYNKKDGHILLTGAKLGEISVATVDSKNKVDKEAVQTFINEATEKYNKLLKDPRFSSSEDYLNFTDIKEARYIDGKEVEYWVRYVTVKESFFRYTVTRTFNNPNSVFFNAACESLKDNYEFANILRTNRKLGTYLGYTESNFFGQEAGCTMLMDMLNGISAEKAYKDLGSHALKGYGNGEDDKTYYKITGSYKDEYIVKCKTKNGKEIGNYTASIIMLPEEETQATNRFITPVYTNQRDPHDIAEEYYLNKSVMIRAMTTTLDPIVLSMGFEYGTDKNHLNKKVLSGTQFNTIDNGEGSYCFASLLEDIELDKTYYYRGYVYDGEYYNYGNICSFKIDKLPDLKISTTSLVLALGHTGIIKISGSGEFDAISSDPETVTVSINNLKDGNADLHIQTHKTGPATITVTDKKTGQTKKIEVTVYPRLQVPAQKLELEEGEKVSFTIAAGSGEYTAKSDKENYATASTKGNEVFIEAISEGDAVVTITDTKTKLTADVAVKVIKKAAIADITLSTQKLNLNVGETGQIEITSGSGEYGVTNLNSDKAKATLNGTTITIQALAIGEAKVVVTDMKTGQKIIIEVTVTQGTTYPDIALSSQEVYLNVGDTEQIEVTSGSGSYSVWVYAPEVANVTVNGKTITIKALSLGSTIVKVTDEVTKKTTTFGIAVIPPSAYDKYAVDLGLSVKWSQINVGAVSVEDWGEHYAWGETESKSYFSWSSYDLCNGTESTITKYNSHDGKTILEPSDDAATVVMGRNWRTPTLTEMQELVNRCKWTQETLNGVKGMRVTGPNGNSIFLPFGGQMSEDVLHHSDTTGYYYVSNLSSDGEKYAPALVCYGNKQEFVPHARFFGLSIRPVFTKK